MGKDSYWPLVKSMSEKIVVIGSGNVASHLAKGFKTAGCNIVQVYSRSLAHASRLADELGDTEAIDSLDKLDTSADLYLIAVSDAAVSEIAGNMPHVNGIVAHTSGSVPLSTLSSASSSTAVLYPLQTFTREAHVRLSEVPFFTEASDKVTQSRIDDIARMLSPRVFHADSAKRKTLHIAGVMSCNFVNYLWDCTAQILERDGYDFSVVEPLIRATLDKAVALGPRESQTGPAIRRDLEVMRDHISRLDPEKAEIYRHISQNILTTHGFDNKL